MSEAIRLREILARLRGPDGCPWDREQTLATLRTFLVEEAYEVIDAIDRDDLPGLQEELGDLLLQIVFQSRIAEEQGAFDFEEVMRAGADKLVRRHPHVFGEERLETSTEVLRQWEEIKSDERRRRGGGSMFASVPPGLPALLKALRLSAKAARVGFEWPDGASLMSKVDEELAELKEAQAQGRSDAVAEELGDLLFTLANVARQADLDPEQVLQEANRKFLDRFRDVEEGLRREGLEPSPEHRDRMEALWEEAKRRSRTGSSLRRTSPGRSAPSGGISGSAPRPGPTRTGR
jgi:MazG family protein